MSSHDQPAGRLDAAAGRDVVFCHACGGEWYRDESGLTCPTCGGEITEIVDPQNDPRGDMHHSSASTSPELHPYDDSDPEEADIEEQFGPHGFHFHRNTASGPNQQQHHNPQNDAVLGQFMRMISDLAPPGQTEENAPGSQNGGRRYGEPQVHHTTIRTGPFGVRTASVTVFTESGPRRTHGPPGHGPPGQGGGDPFQAIFSNILRDMGPPDIEHHDAPPPGFAQGLSGIINMLMPGSGQIGDAVYSQEALDRIITNLMEANPQSNAAPPASDNALETLDRRPVTKEMLSSDHKTECSICIDTLAEGQTAAFLPCKHWFHDECVVAWLKEHNTCPVCRTPIETDEENARGRHHNNGMGSANNDNVGGFPPQGHHPQHRLNMVPGMGGAFGTEPGPGAGAGGHQGPGAPGGSFFFHSFPAPPQPHHQTFPQPSGWSFGEASNGPPTPTQATRPVRYSRPPSQSQTRLNEALRNISSMQQEQVRERDRDSEQSTTTGTSYDTSRLQRRDSTSPTSPRAVPYSEQGAQMRQRSPPQSGRRGTGSDRDARRQQGGGGGPISWLRDRFTGGSGGGSGSGSSRDDGGF